jgi:hypothetical protein
MEAKMSLAQVVYSISNDNEFAKQWKQDPEQALRSKGLELSKEEQAFLTMGFKRYTPAELGKVGLTSLTSASWG